MSIFQLGARRERVESTETIIPLAMVDPKGKVAEVPTSKPHKKRKKSKTLIEKMPKKAKLLSSSKSAVRTTKVQLTLFIDVGLYALICNP